MNDTASRTGQARSDRADQTTSMYCKGVRAAYLTDNDPIVQQATKTTQAFARTGHRARRHPAARPLSFPQAIAVNADATGCHVTHVPTPAHGHPATAAQHGMPAELVEMLTCAATSRQQPQRVRQRPRTLGRPPRDFTNHPSCNAATGDWTEGTKR